MTRTPANTPVTTPSPTEELLARLQVKVPGSRVTAAKDAETAFLLRRPTGILSLDLATGGGFPAGGLSEIHGKENVGKNYLCNLLVQQNQRIYGEQSNVAIASVEYPYDKLFARKSGVSVALSESEIRKMEMERGEDFDDDTRNELMTQTGGIHLLSAPNAEMLLDMIFECVRADLFQLILIDSIATLLVSDEDENGLMDKKMNGLALPRTVALFFRKLTAAYYNQPHNRPNLTSLVVTNQIMAHIGGFARPGMLPPTTVKGGYALKHGKLLSIELKRGETEKVAKSKVGHEVKWRVTKGKAGCADGAEGVFSFSTQAADFGADMREDALHVALSAGVFTKSAAQYAFPSAEIQARGQEAFVERLNEWSPVWHLDIREEVFRAYGISAITKWDL